MKNFRPKSLVSNLHKLLAKVLKNRPNKVVKNSCFKFTECSAEGKQILERCYLLNEVIYSRLKNGSMV